MFPGVLFKHRLPQANSPSFPITAPCISPVGLQQHLANLSPINAWIQQTRAIEAGLANLLIDGMLWYKLPHLVVWITAYVKSRQPVHRSINVHLVI